MNTKRLLECYGRIADAPDAIARLRNFIVDLAVRGKLVPQEPEDEPAMELLKRIAAEKARLSNAGKLKRTDIGSRAGDANVPFAVPPSWAWAILGDVAQYGLSGKVASNQDISDDTWVLDLEDIEKDTSKLIERIRSSARPFQSTKTIFRRGDVLFGKLRPYLNKVLVADQDGVCTSEIIPIRGFCGLIPEYVRLVLKSPLTMARVDRLMYGMKMPRLGTGDAVTLAFPLPPVAEQLRIVAKVDELMVLCDRLEVARAEREAKRDRLTAASIAQLNDPVAFQEGARFALDNLSALTARADQIGQLRQAILNLAVRGKLAPQDENDDPAAELLNRVTTEKLRHVKEGVLPRQKEAARNASRLAGGLPISWQPTALGSVCNLVTSGSRGWAEYYADSGPGFVRAQNIRFGNLRLDELAHVNPPRNSEGSRTQVAKGDLLIVITGAGVTNPALLDREIGEAYVSQHVGLARPADVRLAPWLLLCLMADAGGRAELVERAYGAGKPGLNLDNIRSLSIPIPPLAEQQRIVAKVDELMAICGRLERSLVESDDTRRRLLDALLHEALTVQSDALVTEIPERIAAHG